MTPGGDLPTFGGLLGAGNGGGFTLAWVVFLLVAAALAVLFLAPRLPGRRGPAAPPYVAHAARLRALPRYRELVERRVRLAALTSAATVLLLLGAIVLAGRIQAPRTSEDQLSRDIMLCLDASGSMSGVNAGVVGEFREIVDDLEGERIGLTIWDGAAITVVPLTDDYEFVQEQLSRAQRAFEREDFRFTEGTSHPAGTSQIGDGLVSCVQHFDRLDEERGRAIVLASDNAPQGRGIYTFDQAQDYATDHRIVVHGIAAPATDEVPYASDQFERVVTATGGSYHLLDSDGAAADVAESINDLEASRIDRLPATQVVDRTWPGKALTAVGALLLALAWLAQRAPVRPRPGSAP